MRKAIIGITPLVFTLAAWSQVAPKPPTPAASATGTESATAQPAPPANPITDAQAHELMQLTGTDKIKEQLVANATTYFRRAFPPYMPADVLQDITANLEKADVNTPVVGIYKKYLSTEDAAKSIDFYKTPAGRDLIKATPQILGEAQRSAAQTAQQIVKDTMDRHKTEIETAEKNYQQQHAAPSLGAPSTPAAKPSSAAPATPKTAPKAAPQK